MLLVFYRHLFVYKYLMIALKGFEIIMNLLLFAIYHFRGYYLTTKLRIPRISITIYICTDNCGASTKLFIPANTWVFFQTTKIGIPNFKWHNSKWGCESFSIQSCCSCYAPQISLSMLILQDFVKFRNSKKMYLKLF